MAGLYYRIASSNYLRGVGLRRMPILSIACDLRIHHVVIVIFDRQRGASAETYVAYRFVTLRQPKILDLRVLMMNFAFLRPERRIEGGLGVNPRHCEIGAVDPNPAAIDIFAL